LPHLWPTGSSWVSPSIAARYFSSGPSDSISRWTPCPPKHSEQWLQLRLGCIRLSPSCPFRRVHTFCSPRPARNYPRFWIWHPSFGHQRDLNPPDQRAARRALHNRPTPYQRSCRDCGSSPSSTGPLTASCRALVGPPGSRAWRFHAYRGSLTSQVQ
jgi:hypothetical protein